MKKLIFTLFFIILDLFLLVNVFYLTLYIRNLLGDNFDIPTFNIIEIEKFLFVFVIILFLLYHEKIYRFRYDFWQENLKIFKALGVSYLIVLSILTLTKTNLEYSRLFVTVYFGLLLFLFPVFKRYVKKLLYKKLRWFLYKVNIIGNDEQKEKLKEEFRKNWFLGVKYSPAEYESVYVLSKGKESQEVSHNISEALEKSKEVFIVPYVSDINFAHSYILDLNNIRLNAIVVENKLLSVVNRVVKNLFDLSLVVVVLPLYLCIHGLIAVVIKIDSPGKVFFRQKRLGKDGKVFEVYKYRTMYEDSQALLEEYLKKHPEEVAYYEVYHKYKNDPRITKVGKVLRATSLDELPQIFNIVKGEMSFIGPRPYMVEEKEKLGKDYEIILKVKPGITGLWQVSGRNDLTFKQRNELEVWYIKNWSLWLDVIIFFKTIKEVLKKTGAY